MIYVHYIFANACLVVNSYALSIGIASNEQTVLVVAQLHCHCWRLLPLLLVSGFNTRKEPTDSDDRTNSGEHQIHRANLAQHCAVTKP